MFARTSADLEFDKVLSDISKYCLSTFGVKSVLRNIPITDVYAYKQRQKQVSEVIKCQIKAQTEAVQTENFPDIDYVFDVIIQNPTATLEGIMICDIGNFINSASLLRQLFCLRTTDEGLNYSEVGTIDCIINPIDEELLYLKQEIFKILDASGEVKENYPTIKKLKENLNKKRIERSQYAENLIHTNFELMNGEQAVFRDGRIVLPVKTQLHNKLSGYIQGASQTGNTIFMEPFPLVEKNNEVLLATQEIEIEIAKLLKMLTDLIRKAEQKLRILVYEVTQADNLFAFATWARVNNCCKVILNTEYSCNLIKARHPLLKEKCVPIDLSIPSNLKAVVLTGPNAGGKTVTIKTVGLFSLLNQSCGYIPASDGSSLAIFDKVFTDIGDDQSIENHLSTFSGHMKSISFVLRSLTPQSLVILDELGSGTDPQEGAALARAILEYCTENAVLTLTTSHHGVLKQYAYSSNIVLNASMEFDEKTSQPTFKVISGLPGESHAIDTAKRMFLPHKVISDAQKYMGKEAVKISSIIRGLEQKQKETNQMQAEISARLKEIKQQQQNLSDKEQMLAEYEIKLQKEGLKDFDNYIKDSRKELELLVKELREGEITKEKTRKVKDFILELQAKKNINEEELKIKESQLDEYSYKELQNSKDNVLLKPGMDVLCGKYKRQGTIIRQESEGKWLVAVDTMKIVFKETDLLVARHNVQHNSYTFTAGSKIPQPKLSLDLRGMRLNEALEAIDNEIEACCMHGIKNFSVIHGYGDGILSSGIHKNLALNVLVEKYNFAHPDDGGQGKTYVYLK